jgi:hypothetical protein
MILIATVEIVLFLLRLLLLLCNSFCLYDIPSLVTIIIIIIRLSMRNATMLFYYYKCTLSFIVEALA